MSIHEEGTNSVSIPMMAVFNNLVLYDQHVAQNSLNTIVPDLAESWSWSEDGTRLTFKLREGVKWHDGAPFTSADVKCTWDLLTGRAAERLRLNPRKSWWNNVAEVVPNGPAEATFVLKRPQPAILALIASGYTPIYPHRSGTACHESGYLGRLCVYEQTTSIRRAALAKDLYVAGMLASCVGPFDKIRVGVHCEERRVVVPTGREGGGDVQELLVAQSYQRPPHERSECKRVERIGKNAQEREDVLRLLPAHQRLARLR
jgi:hypothetical protein